VLFHLTSTQPACCQRYVLVHCRVEVCAWDLFSCAWLLCCCQAFPEVLELRPHTSAAVRLAFRPTRDGAYYWQTLTVLAGLKAMRSFRLVHEDDSVVPPWCFSILVSCCAWPYSLQ